MGYNTGKTYKRIWTGFILKPCTAIFIAPTVADFGAHSSGKYWSGLIIIHPFYLYKISIAMPGKI